jgi:hypothetical protein
MLITIVAGGAGSAAIQAGRALLQKYEEQVRTALVTTACEVLVGGCGALVLINAFLSVGGGPEGAAAYRVLVIELLPVKCWVQVMRCRFLQRT